MTDFWENPIKDGAEFLEKIRLITLPSLTNKQVVQIYDKWAETYDHDTTTSGYYQQPQISADVVEEVLGPLKDARILDAPAGTGLLAEILQTKGYTNIDALDASPKMLEVARKKNLYKHIICDFMGPNRLAIEDDTYDLVVSCASFSGSHVKQDCFPEIIRITKKGGYFVLPFREDNFERWEEYRGKLQPAMDALKRDGLWCEFKRDRVEDMYAGHPGVNFVFQIL